MAKSFLAGLQFILGDLDADTYTECRRGDLRAGQVTCETLLLAADDTLAAGLFDGHGYDAALAAGDGDD